MFQQNLKDNSIRYITSCRWFKQWGRKPCWSTHGHGINMSVCDCVVSTNKSN